MCFDCPDPSSQDGTCWGFCPTVTVTVLRSTSSLLVAFFRWTHTRSPVWQNQAPLSVPRRGENFWGYSWDGFASFVLVAGSKADPGKWGQHQPPQPSWAEQNHPASSAQLSTLVQAAGTWGRWRRGGRQSAQPSSPASSKKGLLGTVENCASAQRGFPCCDAVMQHLVPFRILV